MLNGPALLRVFLVVVAAAILTGLVQHYWSFDSGPSEVAKPVVRPTAQSTAIRRAEPATVPAAAGAVPALEPSAAQPSEAPKPAQQAQPLAPPPPPDEGLAAPSPSPAPAAPEPVSDPPTPVVQPPLPPAAAPAPAQSELTDETAAGPTDGRAVDLVDLNTASLEALNRLKGGGSIGRAIIQRRPYSSTDQLLSKRVLSRTVYQRIKDQVTVR
ncbi:ComEA family DNA-binding protein [Methylobacterium gnaphalii]|uniref:Helix-hairpin-helix domain-containing protein n=1 Tax=Methylobacterium gnaphalii TaxID=1010610 RepID=A0A512JLD0_9HYPH|nr:helix-hairpin-helix domain-containing protein [Methylobacterium gnaphalii]GEP10760.1 hypothetical protein MGN01_26050 [Methylobacterium gnaphalii]GJD67369.1 hypothetical protein MMMDOFMJ_0284 [Methylobacterium gnaphalii]